MTPALRNHRYALRLRWHRVFLGWVLGWVVRTGYYWLGRVPYGVAWGQCEFCGVRYGSKTDCLTEEYARLHT
jgi:hypothetical protein